MICANFLIYVADLEVRDIFKPSNDYQMLKKLFESMVDITR